MEQKPKEYVAGLAYYSGVSEWWVVLIKKIKPLWQAGRWNGVGGKVEEGETPLEAMIREFYEEAGIELHNWEHFATLKCTSKHSSEKGGTVTWFTCDLTEEEKNSIKTVTDELVELWPIEELPDTLTNVPWLVKMSSLTCRKNWPYLIIESSEV